MIAGSNLGIVMAPGGGAEGIVDMAESGMWTMGWMIWGVGGWATVGCTTGTVETTCCSSVGRWWRQDLLEGDLLRVLSDDGERLRGRELRLGALFLQNFR